MQLPRDEIAFRKRYEALVLSGALTVIFRPGNRVFPNWRGYIEGERVTARIIERTGCDDQGIAPQFNTHKIPVNIAQIETIHFNELQPEHFIGSSPDVICKKTLKAHLEVIYGESLEHFRHQVTRIQLDYIESASSVMPSAELQLSQRIN